MKLDLNPSDYWLSEDYGGLRPVSGEVVIRFTTDTDDCKPFVIAVANTYARPSAVFLVTPENKAKELHLVYAEEDCQP